MNHAAANGQETSGLPVVQVAEIPVEAEPRRWLIEGLWGAGAVGFIGGPPKCCKSYLGLELAMSVATAMPALGVYPVREPGPALVYLAEDALSAVRERAAGLARHHAIDLGRPRLYVITVPRLRLDRGADRARLFETVRQLRPRLLLLDPLVRLHAIDENRAPEVAQLLSGLRELQRRHDVAVVIVHHTRKSVAAGDQAGQGLRGSTDLHAFGDSNLYVRRDRGNLVLSMEHRAAAAPQPVGLELVTADPQAIHLRVTQRPAALDDEPAARRSGLADAVQHALAGRPSMTRQALREELAVRNETLGRTLERLEREGRVERCREGWRSASSSQRSVPAP